MAYNELIFSYYDKLKKEKKKNKNKKKGRTIISSSKNDKINNKYQSFNKIWSLTKPLLKMFRI